MLKSIKIRRNDRLIGNRGLLTRADQALVGLLCFGIEGALQLLAVLEEEEQDERRDSKRVDEDENLVRP